MKMMNPVPKSPKSQISQRMSPLAWGAALLAGLSLAGCGGGQGGGGGGSASVPSALNPFASGHSCSVPTLSGSAEQKACFAEAQSVCPEDQPPGRTEFEQQPDGQYLITGYVCTYSTLR